MDDANEGTPVAGAAGPDGGASPGFGRVLSLALLIKLAALVLLVLIADGAPPDARYLAPREGSANDVVWYLARGFDAQAYQRMALSGFQLPVTF